MRALNNLHKSEDRCRIKRPPNTCVMCSIVFVFDIPIILSYLCNVRLLSINMDCIVYFCFFLLNPSHAVSLHFCSTCFLLNVFFNIRVVLRTNYPLPLDRGLWRMVTNISHFINRVKSPWYEPKEMVDLWPNFFWNCYFSSTTYVDYLNGK